MSNVNILFMFICVCLCVCGYPLRPKDAIRSPGAGVRGDCEIPSTGAGKWTEFLTKSRKHFLPLIHLGVYVLTFVLCLVSLDKT